MQQEWISISTQLGDDKRHAVLHLAGDVVDIATKAIELGHDDWRLFFACPFKRCIQFGPVINFAALNVLERRQESIALSLGKALQGFLLRLQAEPGTPLLCGGYADVSNCWLHGPSP